MVLVLLLLSLVAIFVPTHSKDIINRLNERVYDQQHDAVLQDLLVLQLDKMQLELNALQTQHRRWNRMHHRSKLPVSAAYQMATGSVRSKRVVSSKPLKRKAIACLLTLWFASAYSGNSNFVYAANPDDQQQTKQPSIVQKLQSLFQDQGSSCDADGTKSTNIAQRVPAAVNKAVSDIMEKNAGIDINAEKIGDLIKTRANEIWENSLKEKFHSGKQYTEQKLAQAAQEISKEIEHLPFEEVSNILAENVGERAMEEFKLHMRLTGELFGKLGSLASDHVRKRVEERKDENNVKTGKN